MPSSSFMLTLLVVILSLWSTVDAHGWMSSPSPRGQFATPKKYEHEEFSPAAINGEVTTKTAFACRDDGPIPDQTKWLSLTAGGSQSITLSWNAPHIGDCFVYLSYDGAKPLNQMKWFKIWEKAKCSPDGNTKVSTYSVPIPSYLPSGDHVVFRWEWYALHAYPTVEYYANCVDAKLTGVAGGSLPTPQVSIPGNLPGDSAAYWHPYDSDPTEYFVGPPIATIGGQTATTATSATSATSKSATTSSSSSSSTSATSATSASSSTSATSKSATTASSATSSSPSTTSTSSNPTTTPTTTPTIQPGCNIGAINCNCTPGGACDAGATCGSDRICLATGPVCSSGIGAIYCACTAGGACDRGLTCRQSVCVDDSALQDPNSSSSSLFVSFSLVLVSLFSVYFL